MCELLQTRGVRLSPPQLRPPPPPAHHQHHQHPTHPRPPHPSTPAALPHLALRVDARVVLRVEVGVGERRDVAGAHAQARRGVAEDLWAEQAAAAGAAAARGVGVAVGVEQLGAVGVCLLPLVFCARGGLRGIEHAQKEVLLSRCLITSHLSFSGLPLKPLSCSLSLSLPPKPTRGRTGSRRCCRRARSPAAARPPCAAPSPAQTAAPRAATAPRPPR